MFRYVDSNLQPKESLVLDILLADSGFYLESLRFKSISDLPVPNDLSGGFIQMRQLYAEFKRLAPHQTAKLKYFIAEVISRSKKDADNFTPTPYGDNENSVIVL